MKRVLVLLIALWVIFPVAADILQTKPSADLLGGGSNYGGADEFLPVSQAFQLSDVRFDKDKQHLVVQFIVAPEYYLYKDTIKLESDNTQITLKPMVLPAAVLKTDPYLGDVEVFYQVLDLTVPIANPQNCDFNFQLSYQGCAEKGLCYPLETAYFSFNAASSMITVAAPTTSTFIDDGNVPAIAEPTNSFNWLTSLYYFVIGLGLAFTPCIFPVLPVLVGVVLRGQLGTARALSLAMTYIVFMAATYAVVGVLAGVFGASFNIPAKLQSPVVLLFFAAFFTMFALAMFGVFELKTPSFIANPVNKTADKVAGGSFLSAAALGICSSLVLSPCVTAPFAAILFYISSTGDALGGGINLFALGLGMGVPFLLIAAGGGALLPKAGNWMVTVRNVFGVLLLVVAVGLVVRVFSGPIELLLWGTLAVGVAIFWGAFNFSKKKTVPQSMVQVIALFLLIYGMCAWVGAWQGHVDPFQPLKSPYRQQSIAAPITAWQTVSTKAELTRVLTNARELDKPVLLDWYADWCVSCKKMEHEILQAPDVLAALADYQLIRLDITKNTQEQIELLESYQLMGPPALLFFNKKGIEVKRIVGETNKDDFVKQLNQLAP